MRLVGLQPVDGSIVPPEASQIVRPGRGGTLDIVGRITSSRMSPTLRRSICLGQLDASLAAPGTELTVRLPDGGDILVRVTEHLAHVDPSGARQQLVTEVPEPLAAATRPPGKPRSPITPDGAPAAQRATGGGADAPVRIFDSSGLAKFGIRAAPDGPVARALGTGFARTTRAADGSLVVGSGPGEWLVLVEQAASDDVRARLETETGSSDSFASVVDLTHARALIRLAGPRSADLLSKVSGIDFSDDVTPDGSALRTSVARLVTDVVREDKDGLPGYLLHCERSSGRYLFEALVDAGTEFGIESIK